MHAPCDPYFLLEFKLSFEFLTIRDKDSWKRSEQRNFSLNGCDHDGHEEKREERRRPFVCWYMECAIPFQRVDKGTVSYIAYGTSPARRTVLFRGMYDSRCQFLLIHLLRLSPANIAFSIASTLLSYAVRSVPSYRRAIASLASRGLRLSDQKGRKLHSVV